MIFWILLGIACLVPFAVAGFVIWDGTGVFAGIGMFFAGVFFAACGLTVATLILLAFAAGTGAGQSRVEKEELRALTVGSSIEGHSFFLGGGYVDGKRVLNYIIKRDGYSTIEQVDASQSRIYEDEASHPYLAVQITDTTNPWLFPWVVWTSERYDFHIPEDSVLENFTIDNGS